MKPPTPKEIVNEWFERVWKAREKSAMDALVADDAVAHFAGGAQVCGIAQFSHLRNMFFGAFPDLSVRILRSVGDDTRACLHWEVVGTYQGDFFGITATNKELPSVARASSPSAMAKSPRGGTVGTTEL